MGRRAVILGMICATPAAASAATLPIEGTYGNEPGCVLARAGNYGEDDGARILTADSLQTMVTYCSFDEIGTYPDKRHHVAMTCATEGSGPEDNTAERADISGSPERGYIVRFADGTSWEALTRC